jgi:hypothetical protein
MSNDDAIYDLRSKHYSDLYAHHWVLTKHRDLVISAAELSLTKHKHLPNSFVQISLPGFKYETEVVKRSNEPYWNVVTRL